MRIQSRPEEAPYGAGAYTLSMDREELEYIASMLYVTRLGKGTYKAAAFKLLQTMEEIFDDDFPEEAAKNVDLMVSVVTADDTITEQHHHSTICLEVK
jgi:hypothetical protein